MIESSVRASPLSSEKIKGWLGTMYSVLTTVPVSSARLTSEGSGALGVLLDLLPPVIVRKPISLLIVSGTTTTMKCSHIGKFTSASVSHC